MSIKLVEVDKTYIFSGNKISALRGVNLQIEKGEIAAFTGAVGSGKTTLLNLICAKDEPSSGKIYVNSTDLGELKERQLANFRHTAFGFILQAYNLISVLSVYENVELPMLAAGVAVKERRVRAQMLLKLAGLTERMHDRPNELCISDQQLIAILCAFANKPYVVLADELTGNLDSHGAKKVVMLLHELSQREGTTVIIATQDPSVVAVANRVFQIDNGAIKEYTREVAASALKMEMFESNLEGSILT